MPGSAQPVQRLFAYAGGRMIAKLKSFVARNAPYLLGWLFFSLCGFLLFLGVLDIIVFVGMVA